MIPDTQKFMNTEMEIDNQRPSYLRRTTCVKCSQNGHVVLNGKDVYCQTCFDDYCAHKFRSSFGKHKIFQPPNERVVIAVSGGPTSTGILVDLIRRSCSADAHKRLQIQPEILHLVESDPNLPPGQDDLAWIESLNGQDIPLHLAHISSIFDDDSAFDIVATKVEPRNFQLPTLAGSSHYPSLIKLLDSFSNDTSRIDFYRRLKTYLLVRCAKKLGIRFLIVGETCTALSSRILSNTTQGRGGQTRDDVHVLDLRWADPESGGVRIVRPLREFQSREIAYYNHFHHLFDASGFSYETSPSLPSPLQSSTLQSVSDDFVEDLQSRFPATVSTLFASASKLLSMNAIKRGATGQEPGNGSGRCRLCASDIIRDEDYELEFTDGFCYGCNLNLSDLNDRNLLPSWLMK